MSALSQADRMKLARVLGMLGSDHVGERAAAGLAATRIVRAAGLQWKDLLQPPPLLARSADAGRSAPSAAPPYNANLHLCVRHYVVLTEWEWQFVNSIVGRIKVTQAQTSKLRQIADSLRARGLV